MITNLLQLEITTHNIFDSFPSPFFLVYIALLNFLFYRSFFVAPIVIFVSFAFFLVLGSSWLCLFFSLSVRMYYSPIDLSFLSSLSEGMFHSLKSLFASWMYMETDIVSPSQKRLHSNETDSR